MFGLSQKSGSDAYDAMYARIQRILKERPWLWAVKSSWLSTDNLNFDRIPSHWYAANILIDRKSVFVHTATGLRENVREVPIPQGISFHGVLSVIKDLGIPIEFLQHIVTVDGNNVWVYSPKKPLTFEDLEY